jgi:hypothetical protein
MSMEAVITEFRELVTQDPEVKVEIRQCSQDELDWAGVQE